MTQDERNTLLVDLCARLPYGVRVKSSRRKEPVTLSLDVMTDFHLGCSIKPYLRPMTSMTEDEKNELRSLLWFGYPSDDFDNYSHRGIEIKMCLYDDEEKSEYDFEDFELLKNFLLKNRFDYRGLIKKGLALEAPEGMYVN